jgi:glycosyltransferase involved in cell wall biosynthesis
MSARESERAPVASALVRVAVDATPLVGPRTGVGRFVESVLPRLTRLEGIEARPYVLSRSARAGELPEGAQRVFVPAGVAVWSWGRGGPTFARAFPRADTIHGTNFIAPPGPHTVVTVHDCTFVTAPDRCTPTVAAFGPVVRRVAASGGWIHALSEHVAAEARELFATSQVVAVHLAAGEVSETPDSASVGRLAPDAPFILSLATLEARKNLPRLVQAFAAVAAHQPDVVLVLAGPDGPDAPAVRAAIEALPAATRERVRTMGFVDDGERAALLTAATVLAYPSLDEGFGLPMLEAWQHDVPVVAARAGALPEVADDAARLVDPLDVDSLAGALEEVLTDEAARAGLVARGRRRLGAFSWDATVEGLVSIYRRAMEAE